MIISISAKTVVTGTDSGFARVKAQYYLFISLILRKLLKNKPDWV
jgi:hypothetical protein